uniref:Uncharacterized protein n=1 Tax=Arundo donax TaxID=35708 RepID=A0A0A9CV80_ARUDO
MFSFFYFQINAMESSTVVTPPKIEASQHQLDEFPSGSPSERTVEVVLPMPRSPITAKLVVLRRSYYKWLHSRLISRQQCVLLSDLAVKLLVITL